MVWLTLGVGAERAADNSASGWSALFELTSSTRKRMNRAMLYVQRVYKV
jgi:hypothetical protein